MTSSADNVLSQAGGLIIKAVNAKGDPVMYITQDKTLNTLQVTLLNSTGADLKLKGGKPVAEKELKPGGPSTLYLIFGTLLTADQLGKVKIVAEGWEAQYFNKGPASSWGLAPKSDVTIEKDHSVVFTITEITPGGEPRSGGLTVNYHNISPVRDNFHSLAMALQNPPSLHKSLQLDYGFIGDDRVFVKDDALHPLKNTLRLFLSNPSPTDPIVSPGTKWKESPPHFSISFVYGDKPGYGALCTIDDGKRIAIDPATFYQDRWICEPNDQDDHPYWKLTPKNHEILGTGAGATVEFRIDTISSNLETGITLMYIQYANIPGYDDGYFTLAIDKELPEPGIRSFDIDEANININEDVHLSWTTFEVAFVELTFQAEGKIQKLSSRDNQIGLNETNFRLKPQASTTYTLSAYNARNMRVGSPVQRIVSLNSVRIKSFTVVPDMIRDGDEVELQWSTQNADRCILTPGQTILPANSDPARPHRVKPAKGLPGYQLIAYKGEHASVPRTVLLMPHPFPKEFPLPPFSINIYSMRAIPVRSGHEWSKTFFGIDALIPLGYFKSDGQYVDSQAGGIGIMGPVQAMDSVVYIALSGLEIEKISFINNGHSIEGWQGNGWGGRPAINSDGFYWYRVKLHWDKDSSKEMFNLVGTRPFKMWAFKG